MKLLLYGDTHWSAYSSIVRSRGKKYSSRLENLIQSVNWAEKTAKENNCDAIVCLGDFFDKPELNSEELTALQEIEWSKDITHYFIVGNHESPLTTLDYNSTNVLRKENFIVVDKPQRLISYGIDILFVPYIVEENRKSISDYWRETNEPSTFVTQELKKLIILSHNDIKGIRYGAFESKEGFDLKDIEAHCDLFINGHLHNSSFLNNKETILNLGNLTGQNFGEDAFKYNHSACILDTNNLKLTFYENPIAFNFYKIKIEKEQDLDLLKQLKQNAIVSFTCKDILVEALRNKIQNYSNIVETRIVIFKEITKLETDDQQIISINDVDHLKQFSEFVLDKLGASNLVKEELSQIIQGVNE